MVNELKYLLFGLLWTTAVFGLAIVVSVGIKLFPGVTMVVIFLAISYGASRLVKSDYEN
jgi:hypothetical protein